MGNSLPVQVASHLKVFEERKDEKDYEEPDPRMKPLVPPKVALGSENKMLQAFSELGGPKPANTQKKSEKKG